MQDEHAGCSHEGIARTAATAVAAMDPELLAWTSSLRDDLSLVREDLGYVSESIPAEILAEVSRALESADRQAFEESIQYEEGHVKPSGAWRVLNKELLVSLLNGSVWGVVVGLVALALYSNVALGVVMTSAVVQNLVVAAFVAWRFHSGCTRPAAIPRMGRVCC